MKRIIDPKKSEWAEILKRPTQTYEDIEQTVIDIFQDIQENGDLAIKKYAKKYDRVELKELLVTENEIKNAKDQISADLKKAIKLAKSNIEKFHRAQITEPVKIETSQGVSCWQEKRAIQKVGLYIPGGTAPLFSSILMLAIPAQIAGCEEIVLCTPSNSKGEIDPAILYTANLCAVTKIFKIGGIQAIGALSFGSESVPKVYKIFGPGNQYVTVAKQIATKYGLAIDLPAGPSELLVFADDTADAAFVASDLLSQAEHGADSQVILVSSSKNMLDRVEREVEDQLAELPRKEIAGSAIANSKLIYCKNNETALDLINEYAPEHFIVCAENEDYFVENIKNAGSVFIGKYSPESAGDYASGTNHTLPTNGYAKNYSGVNLDAFLKAITFQKITKNGIQNIGTAIEKMAAAEGLEAHKNAVSLRLRSIDNLKP